MSDTKWTAGQLALLEKAHAAAENAYCPYSNFPVGAAVQTDKGVFVGCNIENASYGLTICAERAALFSAIAAGAKVISELAVVCVKASETDTLGARMPCGACRQVIAEFMQPESLVLVDGAGMWQVAELLPVAFQMTEPPFFHPTR